MNKSTKNIATIVALAGSLALGACTPQMPQVERTPQSATHTSVLQSADATVILTRDPTCGIRRVLVNADRDSEGIFDYLLVQGGCQGGITNGTVYVRKGYEGRCDDCTLYDTVRLTSDTELREQYGTQHELSPSLDEALRN